MGFVPVSRKQTGVSVATNATSDPAYEVDWEDDDSGNPKNWSLLYRAFILFIASFSTLTVVMYSTSYTSGMPGMMRDFGVTDDTLVVLGVTTYLIGLAAGSVILAPLSEMYGRRPIYIASMGSFCLLILPCALADNLEGVVVTRFFGAICGSAMISNAPGTVNDIVSEEYRALAFSIWSIGPMNGPVVGPLVGGFVYEYLGWRWTNWLVMILAGVAFFLLNLFPETYAPAILRRRSAKMRKETSDRRWWSRYDDKVRIWELLKINLSRPFIMAVKEPICIFWNLYIAVLYAILYLCFVAYPIVFSEGRGWSAGFTGLSYVGIGIGSLIVIVCEPAIRRMINSHQADPETGRPPPEAMVSIVCVAAVCVPVGEIIFAWTCTPNVHWVAPIIAGVPFGAGNCAVFIYASNYLVHSYGIFAASALAGNSVLRSVLGAVLPLAGPSMYGTLGANWAGTLLACLEFALIPIPFVFYRYGGKIRMRSRLIREMRADAERMEAKRKAGEEKAKSKAEREEDEKVLEKEVEKADV
ncbi:major facilitator superfamily domain-containing protein [Lineolata rhizophorae]|uniref:Major facilitator superfamily domain-containing protein n=1 Tax=Lineolata rhizophorae TaxID=578093 RepID=A0A6A6P3Z9_9PEZI|nr:major facilitator superfamily domain-containing protein [Lineolata rhizophorae]